MEVFRFPAGSNTSNLSPLSTSILTRSATGEGVRFVREFSDGSQEVFSQPLGDRYFMTKVSDAQGNSSTVQFDPQMRITSITDPVGRQMTLSYEMSQDPLKITKVTDPFGRSASFGYTADGHLASVTDVLGITSTYQYGAGDFINTLTTPYGTSHFSYADKTTDPSLGLRRILQITDAAGREFRVEYRPLAPGIPFSEPIAPSGIPTFNIYIYGRNSFAWTPEQLVGGLDYTKATIYHFLHDRVSDTITGRTIESIKKPLENRLWFNYDSTGLAFGHEGPNTVNLPRFVGRVLGDGSTRLYRYLYNSHGNKTRSIDPAGRVTNFSYAPNGIDLISVETGGNTLFQASYDGQHNIVSLSNASGGTSVFTWNSRGQMTSHTNELAETTTYTYTGDGNLSSIQAPLDATTQFAYNSAGGLASATDSEGYSVEVIYDAADRPIQLSFPDGTKESLDYRNLDLVSTTDRLGRVNRFEFDAVRRLTQVTDGNGGVATLAYGNFDDPASLQDPGGRQTGFQYDLQGRLSRKQYAGGATQSQSYLPCCGLLGSVTDALGHSKSFSYNLDGTIRNIQYSGSTPPVNFTWDTILPRPLTMTDGQGLSTYTYGAFGAPGANQVTGITGPFGDAASFTYDVAGRPTSQTVNSSAENVTYDALWRPTSTTNALDTFTMSYLGKTGQVTGVTSTTGPSTTYTYAPNAGDRRLSQIKNLGRAGDALSQFDYVYDQVGQITKLTETVGAGNTTGGGGDPCHKKCCHKGKCCKKNKCCKKKCCKGKKDCGRDRCNDRHDNDNDDDDDDDRFGMAPPIDPSILNGLIAFSVASLWASLLWQFARRPRTTTSRLAQVTSAALISALALNGCIFSGGGGTTTGATNVYDFTYDRLGQLVGVDLNQVAQERYSFDPSGNLTSLTIGNTTTSFAANNLNQQTTPGTHVYDAKGQKTTLDGKTFEWDDQGRVTAIVQGTTRSEFAYDGMSRRTKITELSNGTVTSKKLYWWLGGSIVCERDGLQPGFPITKRYFGQGIVQGATKLFYTFDHLGSVRELVDDAGTVQAQYRYSTYGERTKETGNLDSDWGYAGLWHHGPSGLDLATYRLYDAANKRWISRDPLGEGVDYNLYRYCGNSPINFVDPLGLDILPFPLLIEIGAEIIPAIIEGIEALSAGAARAVPHTANAAAAANSSSSSFPDEYGSDRFERTREALESNRPDSEPMQMAKDRSRGRGGNKGKTTEECKLKGAEHTKNASPSKRPKHQKGRARAGRDQLRKEKGDKSRPY